MVERSAMRAASRTQERQDRQSAPRRLREAPAEARTVTCNHPFSWRTLVKGRQLSMEAFDGS